MEERWEMIRWLTKYIEGNQESWEIEIREREIEIKRKLEDWEKAARFRKIEILRERDKRTRDEKEKGEDGTEIKDVGEKRGWEWSESRKDDKNNKEEDKIPHPRGTNSAGMVCPGPTMLESPVCSDPTILEEKKGETQDNYPVKKSMIKKKDF